MTHARKPDAGEPDAGDDAAEPTVVTANDEVAEPPVVTANDEVAQDTVDDTAADTAPADTRRRIDWPRVVAYGVLPAIALLLALTVGAVKYVDTQKRADQQAGLAAMEAAKSAALTMLSYTPETVDAQLHEARNLLTGEFLGQYSLMTDNVVIPGARTQGISAVTEVPAAAVVSADEHHAVVVLFLNQTVTVGSEAPTVTVSSARATLDEVDGRWLVSGFVVT